MEHLLKVRPNYVITHNDRPRRQEGGIEILERNNIKFNISDTCSPIDAGSKPILVFWKDSQISTSISTIYIPLASLITTTLLNNIKNSIDNIIISGDLNAERTDFNCSRMDKWSITLKQALYDENLPIAENELPTDQDSRNNSRDIVDYLISSPAV